MARLEMTLNFNKGKGPLRAERVLTAAKKGLALLRAIERDKSKRRHAKIPWNIDIIMGLSHALIVYRAEELDAAEIAADHRRRKQGCDE